MGNSYLEILKQNNIDIKEKESIFPLYRKSTTNDAIVKFTDNHIGTIVRESPKRNYLHQYNDGTFGKLGSGEGNRWCKYDNKQWWTDLTHEELLEFDENYRKFEKEKTSAKEKLQAMSFLMSSINSNGNNNYDNEVLDALIDIAGLGKQNEQ